MPNLHAHYYLGNVKQFRQELDTSTSSSSKHAQSHVGSGGRSWGASVEMRSGIGGRTDPNERDSYGRTYVLYSGALGIWRRGTDGSVLHLAASSMAPIAYSFFSTLLRNPNISVNLQDHESGHTALHRALYVGNIKAARDLLMRHDIDLGIKDMEGLTAFDLYNGTVEGVRFFFNSLLSGVELMIDKSTSRYRWIRLIRLGSQPEFRTRHWRYCR